MASLKLRSPEQLPAHGLTLQQFKPWKNHLRNYLRQDTDNSQFFPGRLYATWQSQEDHEDRLQALNAQDPEAARLHKGPNIQPAQLERDLTDLLERRNAQLAKFLSLITMLCHYTSLNAIFPRRGSFSRGQGNRSYRGRSTYDSSRSSQPQRKFCRLCYLSGSSAYNSHDISTCRQLTRRDLDALQGRLNMATLISKNDTPPEPLLIPGWDIPEENEDEGQDQ